LECPLRESPAVALRTSQLSGPSGQVAPPTYLRYERAKKSAHYRIVPNNLSNKCINSFLGLPGLAWVEIEASAVEVDGGFEMLNVPEAAGHLLDCLNLAVDTLTHGICYTVLRTRSTALPRWVIT